ncbi:MAG: glutathione S-transferase family protein, partial [Alphaproteobacteria bacterium]|nr:glutathione S-transferase family protein [Alphaproteobacteria bacterium]
QPKVAEDYRKWYLARLQLLNRHLCEREFLCDQRFTIADIAICYALYLGELIGIATDYQPQVKSYLKRMKTRPGFIRALAKE